MVKAVVCVVKEIHKSRLNDFKQIFSRPGESRGLAAGGGSLRKAVAVCTEFRRAVLCRYRRWGPDASLFTVVTR